MARREDAVLIPGRWRRRVQSARRQRLLLPRPMYLPRLALLVRQLLLMQVELLFVPSSPFFLLLFLLLLLPFLLLLPLLLLLLLLRRLLLPLVMLPRRCMTRPRDRRRQPLPHLQAVVDNFGAFWNSGKSFFLAQARVQDSWPTSLLLIRRLRGRRLSRHGSPAVVSGGRRWW